MMRNTIPKLFALILSILFIYSTPIFAQNLPNLLDDLDPRDPNIENILSFYDNEYFKATGQPAFISDGLMMKGTCFRNACPVWAEIKKDEQKLNLYVEGALKYSWAVSTGKKGYTTPDMDLNPNGRIYDSYTSSSFPGGDYNGLGNMPYAVFLVGGYAIHGTTQANWPLLGTAASHGCARSHPDYAFIFNRLVRSYGVGSVWVTID